MDENNNNNNCEAGGGGKYYYYYYYEAHSEREPLVGGWARSFDYGTHASKMGTTRIAKQVHPGEEPVSACVLGLQIPQTQALHVGLHTTRVNSFYKA